MIYVESDQIQEAATTLEKPPKDYSGVATKHLRTILQDEGYCEWSKDEKEEFAQEIGVTTQNFFRIFSDDYNFTGLDLADRICTGLGVEISDLPVIPSGYAHSAKKMALDEFWAKEIEPDDHTLQTRTQQLVDLRNRELDIAYCWMCRVQDNLYRVQVGRFFCAMCLTGMILGDLTSNA